MRLVAGPGGDARSAGFAGCGPVGGLCLRFRAVIVVPTVAVAAAAPRISPVPPVPSMAEQVHGDHAARQKHQKPVVGQPLHRVLLVAGRHRVSRLETAIRPGSFGNRRASRVCITGKPAYPGHLARIIWGGCRLL